MEFFIVLAGAILLLVFIFDIEEPLFPALVIAGLVSGSGDSDNEEEVDTTKRKPTIVTEKKVNTASKKEIPKGLAEDETRVEWEDDNTKWNYHKGQTWETKKNF